MKKEDDITKEKLPSYIKAVYGWLYCSLPMSNFFDQTFLLNLLTLGYYSRLRKSLVKEVSLRNKILQIGATFGNQIDKTAEKIGFKGKYDLIDVCETQIFRCEDKYKYMFPNMRFIRQDATTDIEDKLEDKYDVVICYNLLHELPILSKIQVVDNALNCMKDKGKVVFIEYHNPPLWHPLRYIVRMFNRLYQPFAEKMWDREIYSYATRKHDFIWKKETFFGGFYQKVVATKR